MAEANADLFESQVTGGGIFDFLASGLTTQCNPNRAPDHFDTSLETACSAPENSLPRALLRAGFQVWFAYFLAIQRGRMLGLDQLPHVELEDVTSQIASVHPHESVRRLFSHLFQGSRGKKRQDCLMSIGVQIPALPSFEPRPPKRARIFIGGLASQGRGLMTNHDADHRVQRADASEFLPLYGSIGFDFDPGTDLALPAASNLGLVFPTYLTDVIVKVDGKAWLKASFKNDPTKCELDFFILATETQHIVNELFDIHIAIRNQRRGILLPNDVFAEIGGRDGRLVLSGLRLEKAKLLGDQVVEAYQLSPSRVEEFNDGHIEFTRCLSIVVWPDIHSPSRMRLKVEAQKLTSISSRLWPIYP